MEKRNASDVETVTNINADNGATIFIPASVVKERSKAFGNLTITMLIFYVYIVLFNSWWNSSNRSYWLQQYWELFTKEYVSQSSIRESY